MCYNDAVKQVTVYLSLGSNLGERRENLQKALEFLSQKLEMGKCSSIYETEPIGDASQPKYLNMVCQASTRLSPLALLTLLKGIETRLGRIGISGDSRPIDIDILFYGDQVLNTPRLTIPHAKLMQRAFVLVPLVEIAPHVRHPLSGLTAAELLSKVDGKEGVVKWS